MTDDQKILKELEQAMKMIGNCESCNFHEVDGEYGQIWCCSHDLADHLSSEMFDYLMRNHIRCPLWVASTTLSTGYCKKHNEVYVLSCIACSQCWDEFVDQERLQEESNKV